MGMVLEEAQAARERELQEQRLRKVYAHFTCVTSTGEGKALLTAEALRKAAAEERAASQNLH